MPLCRQGADVCWDAGVEVHVMEEFRGPESSNLGH